MKGSWKKASVLLLTLALMTATVIVPAFAAARSSWYLSAYRAWLTPQAGGKIAVSIDVQAVDYMDDVGAISVQLYQSSDGGSTWARARSYSSALTPELLAHNDFLYYDTPITYQGTAGYKYYAVVDVYAGDSTGSDTKEYVTYTVTAIR